MDLPLRHLLACALASAGALLALPCTAQPGIERYATTLAAWRRNLLAQVDAIRACGYPDTLLRMFDFYLSYCEGGFAERSLGDVQVVLQDARRSVRPTPRV